ncbi:MAG TPA: MarR family winged helix-turn-helix transcriptional regulator [Microbacteriaceae bacterium]
MDPLNPTEEIFWRALMRVCLSLPRRLDADLERAVGVSANEYTTLMCLSEAPDRELRMAELANAAALSASRMTRLVDDLQDRGWVTKRSSSEDGRGNVAKLTPAGLAKLKRAWPAHLASVRARVFDQVDAATVTNTAQALSEIAACLEENR